MKIRAGKVVGGTVWLGLLIAALPARGETLTLGFGCITNNNAGNCGIAEAQMWVDVVDDAESGFVNFLFRNIGPAASSITDVYFDDGTLLGIAGITNGTGVDFSQDAVPGDLPGGETLSPPFETHEGFSADSNPPRTLRNGVNPGETLGIRFELINGKTYADTLAALGDGSLRVGIHVQGFGDGGSESLVNTVPDSDSYAPLATGLLFAGLAYLWQARRRLVG